MSRMDSVRWIIASFIMPLWILRELNEAMKFKSAIIAAIEAGEHHDRG